jgi:hypothetical protein
MLPILAATFLTCTSLVATDGDTIKCDGVRMRLLANGEPFVSGLDTPEISKAKSDNEKAMDIKAKKRLAEILLQPAFGSRIAARSTGRELIAHLCGSACRTGRSPSRHFSIRDMQLCGRPVM